MDRAEAWLVDWGRVSDDIRERLSTNVDELRVFQETVQRFERGIDVACEQLASFEEKLAHWNKGIEAAREEHNRTIQEKRLKLQQREAEVIRVRNEMHCKAVEVALYQKQLIAVQQHEDLLCGNTVEFTPSHDPDSCCNVDCWDCWKKDECLEFKLD
jgi:chromosome segregation ATPase